MTGRCTMQGGQERAHGNRAEALGRRASTAGGEVYAARRAPTARDALRLTAAAVARALGAARSSRRGDISDLDRGRPSAGGLVSGPAGRQAGEAGGAVDAPSDPAVSKSNL